MVRNLIKVGFGFVAAIGLLLMPVAAYAETLTSPSYQIDQSFFGSGGELQACSSGPSGYCSQQSAGELTVGNTKGSQYQAYAGFNTTDQPFLEFVVNAANIDLGNLSQSSASTATGTFYVRAWQASGYVIRSESDPPTNTGPGAHQLTALASPTASSPGTEQFGINLVKNTNFCGAGCDLGADPAQIPDSSFSTGQAASGYSTANLFKYVKGDVVALSNSSTSVTNFTVSYLYNMNTLTPSGQYVFGHVLVATGTY